MSQPRLLQFPLAIHHSLILFSLSQQAAAVARASPPAHLTRSSARAAGHHFPLVEPKGSRPFRRALLILRPEPLPWRCCSEPGQPPPALIRRFFVPLRPFRAPRRSLSVARVPFCSALPRPREMGGAPEQTCLFILIISIAPLLLGRFCQCSVADICATHTELFYCSL